MKSRHLIYIFTKSKQVGHRCKVGIKLPTSFPPSIHILYYCSFVREERLHGFFWVLLFGFIFLLHSWYLFYKQVILWESECLCFPSTSVEKLLGCLSWESVVQVTVKKCGCSYLSAVWQFPVSGAQVSRNCELYRLFYSGLTLWHMLCTASTSHLNHHPPLLLFSFALGVLFYTEFPLVLDLSYCYFSDPPL